jgi:hypothetical protein
MLRNISKAVLPLLLTLGFAACHIDPIEDPNNPSVGGLVKNPALSEIQNLVTGIEAGMRLNLGFYFDGVGVIGREFYRFSTSDPRFSSDLLGKGTATLDNNTFYTTNPYSARYRVVKNANILLEAVGNASALTDPNQANASKGFANTIKAYQLLLVWVQQYDNGIRIEVSDPDHLGPFVGEGDAKASIRAIAGILQDGYTQLTAGAADFPFTLSSGFAGYDKPASFAKFNRAIAARVQAYSENWDLTLEALGKSFLNLNGSINDGVYHPYSTAGGDALNPLWYPLNAAGESRVAQPSFVTDAEAGDSRLSKVTQRAAPEALDGLTSDYDVTVYATNTTSVPLVRNEELILLYAEAKIQKGAAADLTDAVSALNYIRNVNNLPNYAGATDKASLITEMLKQRRYSLYGEGHRWVDMRRYNLLGTLPIDRVGDDVWTKFPRPANEQ